MLTVFTNDGAPNLELRGDPAELRELVEVLLDAAESGSASVPLVTDSGEAQLLVKCEAPE